MFTQLKNRLKCLDRYLFLSFLLGLIPVFFITHVIPVDFSGYYFQAISFLKYHGFSYQILTNHCDNPINSGLNARSPLVPFFMALSIGVFGKTLLGIYLPFIIGRVFITPTIYLAATRFLSKRIAFLASLLILFLPKIQTYSLGAPEADIFVALFYSVAIYFYMKSKKLAVGKYAALTGASLGIASLAKATGLAIAIGFILAIFLQNFAAIKKRGKTAKNFLLTTIYLGLFILPYLTWTVAAHQQLYISTQHDKSIMYIFSHIQPLFSTIPLYLGLNFSIGTKAFLTSFGLLSIFVLGIGKILKEKYFVLVFPTVITLLLIGSLETCLMGGDTPFNYEFATILSFTMIPAVIALLVGTQSTVSLGWKTILKQHPPRWVVSIFLLLLMFKFINSHFSTRYALDFIPSQYYISLPTILSNKEMLPDIQFEIENDLRIFKGPIIHKDIRKQFIKYKSDPFSPLYKKLLLYSTGVALIIFVFDKQKKER